MRACGVRVWDIAHGRLTILFCKALSLHLSFCSAVPSVQSVDSAVLLINGAALLHELIRVRIAILAKMNRIVVVIVRRLCIKADERVIVLLFY